jgi:hypothetical protein
MTTPPNEAQRAKARDSEQRSIVLALEFTGALIRGEGATRVEQLARVALKDEFHSGQLAGLELAIALLRDLAQLSTTPQQAAVLQTAREELEKLKKELEQSR